MDRNRKLPRRTSCDVFENTKAIILRFLLGKFGRVSNAKASVQQINCPVFHLLIELFEVIDELFSITMEPSPVNERQRTRFSSKDHWYLELDSDADSRDESDNENDDSTKSEVRKDLVVLMIIAMSLSSQVKFHLRLHLV